MTSSPNSWLRRVRIPWTVLPLLLALGYAGVRVLVAEHPSVDRMVPRDAFLVRRWRDLATYDRERGDPAEVGTTVAAPSAVLGAELNIPGLPGIDRSRPIIDAVLPLDMAEPRLVVLPVDDAAALRARYRDPNLPERHARHLEIHGAWAASSTDRSIARDAGTYDSPLPPAEPDEDWCVTADWPVFVDFVSRPEQASNEPFSRLLEGLGFDPSSASTSTGPDGRAVLTVSRTGRVPLVRDAWARATLRSFPAKVVVELEPARDATELKSRLAAVRPDPADDREVALPSPTEASLHVRGAQGRRVLVFALGYGGLRWPEAAAKREFEALRLDGAGGITLWAELADGPLPTWDVTIAARATAFPELAAFAPTEHADGGPVVFPAGAATLTTPYGSSPERTTFLPVASAGDPDLLVTVFGARADAMREKARASLSTHARSSPRDTPERVEVATFTLGKFPAQRLLGAAALGPTGLFATLAEHALGRVLVVDGARLRIEIEASDAR